MKRTRAHDSLVAACMKLLALRKVPATRINQRPVQTAKGWRCPGADPGTPDIIACLPPRGRLLGIECKTGKGRPTKSQIAWAHAFSQAGGLGVVVYDIESLTRFLDELTEQMENERRRFG